MRTAAIALATAFMASPAHAGVVTFQGDNDVVFTRCTDAVLETVCEMIFPPGTAQESYVCVAIDHSGDPIGSTLAPGKFQAASGAWFHGLSDLKIDDVKCRRR